MFLGKYVLAHGAYFGFNFGEFCRFDFGEPIYSVAIMDSAGQVGLRPYLSVWEAGVTGISVLTDQKYFGGSLEDLTAARAECQIPILRKEFIIDPYQLFEAKAHGADTILLIAAVLDRERIKQLSETAQSIGLEVLLEVHNQEELNKALMPSLNMIGVNNRNLKTFEVSIENSMSLAEYIPNDFVKVSESGISSTAAIKALNPYGYEGFLIGENFMKSESPGLAASSFIKTLIQ